MKNGNKSAYPIQAHNVDDPNGGFIHLPGSDGLTKREKACIELGIPETGDKALDDLIRKAERKKIAAQAMQGLLSADATYEGETNRVKLSQDAVRHADILLHVLEE